MRGLIKAAEKSGREVNEIVAEIINTFGWKFYFIIGLCLGVTFFSPLSDSLESTVDLAALIFVVAWVTLALQRGVKISVERYSRRPEANKALKTALPSVGTLVVIILWFVAATIGLSSAGMDVAALVAGFGVVGIAIAFAVQKILADLFSAFVIFTDTPFRVGDYIAAGGVSGTVENIGLKTTKIRSLDGEKFIVPNRDLVDGQVRNFEEIVLRRSSLSISISLETEPEKLKSVSQLLQEAVDEADERTQFYRATLTSITIEAFEYQVLFFAEVEGLVEFNVLEEKVLLRIINKLKEHEIKLASLSRLYKK